MNLRFLNPQLSNHIRQLESISDKIDDLAAQFDSYRRLVDSAEDVDPIKEYIEDAKRAGHIINMSVQKLRDSLDRFYSVG